MKINRRKLLSILGVSPAVLAGSPGVSLAAEKKVRAASGEPKIETLNPKGSPPPIQPSRWLRD
jgi:hypothetical protein